MKATYSASRKTKKLNSSCGAQHYAQQQNQKSRLKVKYLTRSLSKLLNCQGHDEDIIRAAIQCLGNGIALIQRGKLITIPMAASETVAKVRANVEAICGTSPSKEALVVGEAPLHDDSQTLIGAVLLDGNILKTRYVYASPSNISQL